MHLDKYEVLYLLEKNKIVVFQNNKEIPLSKLKSKINSAEFEVFKDLRDKGFIAKTGLKYGTTFRIYKPKKKELIKDIHSEWLLDVVFQNEKIKIKDFSAKNRISHSCKKKYVLAIVDSEKSITYIESSWIKMQKK